jgi:propanol-preferring alcohol dehydrogenase
MSAFDALQAGEIRGRAVLIPGLIPGEAAT